MVLSYKRGAAAVAAALAGLWLAAAPASGQERSLTGDAGVTLTPEGDVVFRSRSYDLAFVPIAGSKPVPVLLDGLVETKRSMVNPDDIASGRGMITLAVRKVEAKGFGTPLAAVKIPGDSFTLVDDDQVDITLFGAGGTVNNAVASLHLPDLGVIAIRSDDMPVMTATIKLDKSAIGRMLSIYKVGAALDRMVLPSPDIAAILTWSDGAVPLQRIALRGPSQKLAEDAANWDITPGWNMTGPDADTHVALDKAKPQPVHFKWQIDDNRLIDIPLAADRLNLAAAVLPPGFKLEDLAVR